MKNNLFRHLSKEEADFKICKEYRNFLPPHNEQEFKVLEERIINDRCIRDPLVTFQGKLLDGHARYEIAKKHNLMYPVMELKVDYESEALIWLYENHAGRRNLSKFLNVEMLLKLKPYYENLGKKNKGRKKDDCSEIEQNFKPVNTLKEISKLANCGRTSVYKVEKILKKGKPDLLQQCRRGEKSINQGYNEIRIKQSTGKKKKLRPYTNPAEGKYINQIINADCLQTLKDMHFHGIDNIALLVTSIPYSVGMNYGVSEDNVDNISYQQTLDYIQQALYYAQLCGREGMKICINCADTKNPDYKNSKGDYYRNIIKDLSNKIDELNEKYDDCNLYYLGKIHWFKDHTNASPYLGSYALPSSPVLRVDTEDILVFCKGQSKIEKEEICDEELRREIEENKVTYEIQSKEYVEFTRCGWMIPAVSSKDHPCPFNAEIPRRLIKMFTFPNDIIIDPFCGIGTSCRVASDLKRRYIGIDTNPEYCNIAKEKIEESLKESDSDEIDNDNVIVAA